MTNKAANAGALLIASIGMMFTAFGLIGVSPTQIAHHQNPATSNVECHQ